MDATERMPGDAEAAAAAAGMAETYGTLSTGERFPPLAKSESRSSLRGSGSAPRRPHHIGKRLSYRPAGWREGYQSARVVAYEGDRIVVEHEDGSGIEVIEAGDVLPF